MESFQGFFFLAFLGLSLCRKDWLTSSGSCSLAPAPRRLSPAPLPTRVQAMPGALLGADLLFVALRGWDAERGAAAGPGLLASAHSPAQPGCPPTQVTLLREGWSPFGEINTAVGFHRLIEQFGLEGTAKGHRAQPHYHEQGHLQTDQVAQSPVQPGLECFQGWGIEHLCGQPVPVFHHPWLSSELLTLNTLNGCSEARGCSNRRIVHPHPYSMIPSRLQTSIWKGDGKAVQVPQLLV